MTNTGIFIAFIAITVFAFLIFNSGWNAGVRDEKDRQRKNKNNGGGAEGW